MIELKTLKDIENNGLKMKEVHIDGIVNKKILRTEAIKWCKYIHKKWKLTKNKLPKTTTWQELAEVDCFYLMKFFDITKKELKK